MLDLNLTKLHFISDPPSEYVMCNVDDCDYAFGEGQWRIVTLEKPITTAVENCTASCVQNAPGVESSPGVESYGPPPCPNDIHSNIMYV